MKAAETPEAGPRCAAGPRVGVDPLGRQSARAAGCCSTGRCRGRATSPTCAALQHVRDATAGTGLRLQLQVPPPDAATWTVTMLDLDPDDAGWFSGYRRHTRQVDPAALVDTAVGMVTARDRQRPAAATSGERADDVLVCGHGSRDRCCGSRDALALTALAQGHPVRRTSHLGGHRFAPTALLLPEGTAWGSLDDALLDR